MNHGVLRELDQKDAVQVRKSLLVGLKSSMGQLIVEVRQKPSFLVVLHVIWVTEVARGSDQKLGDSRVDQMVDDPVYAAADGPIEAMRDLVHAHVWSSRREHIVDVMFGVTRLGYVAGDQTALGESHDVETRVVEPWVGLDLGTGLLGLAFEGLEP